MSGWEWFEDTERRRYDEEQRKDRLSIDQEKEFEQWVRQLTQDPSYEAWLRSFYPGETK